MDMALAAEKIHAYYEEQKRKVREPEETAVYDPEGEIEILGAEVFREQVRCIRKRKMIRYLRASMNIGGEPNLRALSEILDREMEPFERRLAEINMRKNGQDADTEGRGGSMIKRPSAAETEKKLTDLRSELVSLKMCSAELDADLAALALNGSFVK